MNSPKRKVILHPLKVIFPVKLSLYLQYEIRVSKKLKEVLDNVSPGEQIRCGAEGRFFSLTWKVQAF